MPPWKWKKPSVVRPPVRKGVSRGSISLNNRPALLASVRATSRVGIPITSAARRAAISFCTNSEIGTTTLPPRCPHFFAEESWSSKCTAAAPASIMPFINSKALSRPPKPASASATMGANQCRPPAPSVRWICRPDPMQTARPFGAMDLVGTLQGVVDGAHHRGHAVGRIQALVRIHLAAQIGIARHLPAAQVDRLQPGLHLLHRLIAGERTERRHVWLGV